MYDAVCNILKVLMKFVFRIKSVGGENVPDEGGVILSVNHRSNWDPVIAGLTCKRHLRFMAKAELFENKLFGALITRLGAFPIKRGSHDISAVKSSLAILKSGEVMLMFPEGKRARHGEKLRAKTGVSMIAVRARVPVIPVYIEGDYKWMHKITVHYGKPILLDEYYDKKPSQEELQGIADSILETMRALPGVQRQTA